MKPTLKTALLCCALGCAAITSTAALAQHHRSHTSFGFYFGGPLYAPYYYPPPYYYGYPPVVVAPAAPTTYVERSDIVAAAPQAAAPAETYWYYCPDTQTYHPYVKTCASPWQRVSPQPPAAPR